MAIVWIYRLAIWAAGRGTANVYTAQGAGAPGAVTISAGMLARIAAGNESDSALSAALSDEIGYAAQVATYADPFELRKVQVLFGRNSGSAAGDDDAVITFHLLRLISNAPSATWVEADFLAFENAFDTMWTALKPHYYSFIRLKQMRWYKTGPQVDIALGGVGRTGPPVRVVERNVVGTGVATACPPQVAISVTEQTDSAKAWGRFYLPHPSTNVLSSGETGRLSSTVQTTIGNAVDALYESCRTAGVPIVVYSSAKPTRPQSEGPNLPAQGARALTVNQLQVDDILDVIRSRRWKSPLLRLQRAVG